MEGGDGEGGSGTLLVLDPKPFKPFKSKDEYLYAMKEDLSEWFFCLYRIDISVENFFEVLETGVILCDHAVSVQNFARERRILHHTELELRSYFIREIPDGGIPCKHGVKPKTFQARDNISNFITWCRKLGIPQVLLFETDDLVLRKNERSVVLCLLEVARIGAKLGMLAPVLVQMEEEIDAELAGEPPPQIKTCDLLSLDEMVRELVGRCTCPAQFPIIQVGNGKYKIGDSQTLIFVRILRNHVMVRVGGGWDTLENYLDKHDPCRCGFRGHRNSPAPGQYGSKSGPAGRRTSAPSVQQTKQQPPRSNRSMSVAGPNVSPNRQTTEYLHMRSPSPEHQVQRKFPPRVSLGSLGNIAERSDSPSLGRKPPASGVTATAYQDSPAARSNSSMSVFRGRSHSPSPISDLQLAADSSNRQETLRNNSRSKSPGPIPRPSPASRDASPEPNRPKTPVNRCKSPGIPRAILTSRPRSPDLNSRPKTPTHRSKSPGPGYKTSPLARAESPEPSPRWASPSSSRAKSPGPVAKSLESQPMPLENRYAVKTRPSGCKSPGPTRRPMTPVERAMARSNHTDSRQESTVSRSKSPGPVPRSRLPRSRPTSPFPRERTSLSASGNRFPGSTEDVFERSTSSAPVSPGTGPNTAEMDTTGEINIDRISTMTLSEFKNLLSTSLSVPNGDTTTDRVESPRAQVRKEPSRSPAKTVSSRTDSGLHSSRTRPPASPRRAKSTVNLTTTESAEAPFDRQRRTLPQSPVETTGITSVIDRGSVRHPSSDKLSTTSSSSDVSRSGDPESPTKSRPTTPLSLYSRLPRPKTPSGIPRPSTPTVRDTGAEPRSSQEKPRKQLPRPSSPYRVGAPRQSHTPEPISRRSHTPEPTTRRSHTPEPTARRSHTPEPITRRSHTPEPITRRSHTPEPITRRSHTPEPITRRSHTPEPITRRSHTPEPTTRRSPEPAARRSHAPEPTTHRSHTPELAEPRSNTPEPIARRSQTPEPMADQVWVRHRSPSPKTRHLPLSVSRDKTQSEPATEIPDTEYNNETLQSSSASTQQVENGGSENRTNEVARKPSRLRPPSPSRLPIPRGSAEVEVEQPVSRGRPTTRTYLEQFRRRPASAGPATVIASRYTKQKTQNSETPEQAATSVTDGGGAKKYFGRRNAKTIIKANAALSKARSVQNVAEPTLVRATETGTGKVNDTENPANDRSRSRTRSEGFQIRQRPKSAGPRPLVRQDAEDRSIVVNRRGAGQHSITISTGDKKTYESPNKQKRPASAKTAVSKSVICSSANSTMERGRSREVSQSVDLSQRRYRPKSAGPRSPSPVTVTTNTRASGATGVREKVSNRYVSTGNLVRAWEEKSTDKSAGGRRQLPASPQKSAPQGQGSRRERRPLFHSRSVTPGPMDEDDHELLSRPLSEIKAALRLPINGVTKIQVDPDMLAPPPEDPVMYQKMEELFQKYREKELNGGDEALENGQDSASSNSEDADRGQGSADDEASVDSNANIKSKLRNSQSDSGISYTDCCDVTDSCDVETVRFEASVVAQLSQILKPNPRKEPNGGLKCRIPAPSNRLRSKSVSEMQNGFCERESGLESSHDNSDLDVMAAKSFDCKTPVNCVNPQYSFKQYEPRNRLPGSSGDENPMYNSNPDLQREDSSTSLSDISLSSSQGGFRSETPVPKVAPPLCTGRSTLFNMRKERSSSTSSAQGNPGPRLVRAVSLDHSFTSTGNSIPDTSFSLAEDEEYV